MYREKIRQISLGISELKTKISLTQLCELQWVTESNNLVIDCPNLEIREELARQINKFQELKIGVDCFIITFGDQKTIIKVSDLKINE